MYVLNNILNEGSADMIDKNYAIAHDNELPMGSKFKDFLLFQADSVLKQIDTSIIKMAQSDGKIFKTEKEYRDLLRWTSGHCPGYYMANIIVRNGFKKKLLKNIQNHFYFFIDTTNLQEKIRQNLLCWQSHPLNISNSSRRNTGLRNNTNYNFFLVRMLWYHREY